MKSILDQIGPTLPHHFTLRVRLGRMLTAKAFFTEFLGSWREVVERRKFIDGGAIRWVQNVLNPSVLIQLTEIYKDDGAWDDEMHLAIASQNPRLAAQLTGQMFEANLSAGEPITRVTDLGNECYWVEIPAIFGCAIEFVPIE